MFLLALIAVSHAFFFKLGGGRKHHGGYGYGHSYGHGYHQPSYGYHQSSHDYGYGGGYNDYNDYNDYYDDGYNSYGYH